MIHTLQFIALLNAKVAKFSCLSFVLQICIQASAFPRQQECLSPHCAVVSSNLAWLLYRILSNLFKRVCDYRSTKTGKELLFHIK